MSRPGSPTPRENNETPSTDANTTSSQTPSRTVPPTPFVTRRLTFDRTPVTHEETNNNTKNELNVLILDTLLEIKQRLEDHEQQPRIIDPYPVNKVQKSYETAPVFFYPLFQLATLICGKSMCTIDSLLFEYTQALFNTLPQHVIEEANSNNESSIFDMNPSGHQFQKTLYSLCRPEMCAAFVRTIIGVARCTASKYVSDISYLSNLDCFEAFATVAAVEISIARMTGSTNEWKKDATYEILSNSKNDALRRLALYLK